MDLKIIPQVLCGDIYDLQSKSYAHRIIIASSLAGNLNFENINLNSDDVSATAQAMKQIDNAKPVIDANESGTTLRLLLPIFAVLKDNCTFKLSEGLAKRPLKDLLDVLNAQGCEISFKTTNDKKHISVKGKLRGGDIAIRGDVSSQYISGLLYALPLAERTSTLTITTPIKSRPYVDMTLKILRDFGVDIKETKENQNTIFHIDKNQKYVLASDLSVETDWSNAAFWLVANFLGNEVKVLGLNDCSLQGDKIITNLLEQFKSADEITVDLNHIPDLFPILAVAASFREKDSVTNFTNLERLRTKESDRLLSTMEMLENLGGNISLDEREESLVAQISSLGGLSGGIVNSYNDHRIAMSSAIAATKTKEAVTIKDAMCVKKSYPHFFEDYEKLGGEIVKF